MRPGALVTALRSTDDQLSTLVKSSGFRSWRAKVEAVGGCAKPVRLAGSALWSTADGRVVREVEGSLFSACGNRRESVCPSCSARYAADTFHLVRAGLSGGKGIPTSVASGTRLFVTLTPPSFGPVHNRPTTRTGKARPCGCGDHHHEYDTRLGQAIDPDTYDYEGAVLWQAHAPELWRRFTIAVSRHLASALGVARSRLREHLRVSYVKVAEYQRRGLVHFHAVIRIDGPDGPGSPAPTVMTEPLMEQVIRSAASSVTVDSPHTTLPKAHDLTWGEQVDIAPITPTDPDDPQALAQDRRVAGYIAKYSTKGTGTGPGVDVRVRDEHHITTLDVTPHARRMITTAWELGGRADLAPLRLRRWAHMLGFRGHFLTKSRQYSVTFGTLRTARVEHHRERELAELGIHDPDDITITNQWAMTGVGYATQPERDIAASIAQQTADKRKNRLGEH